MEPEKWWEMRWPRRHALALPFGACGVTALLTWLTTGGQGDLAANLKVAADMVDLGAAIYGMVAVTIEGGVRRMFWAWEKHQAVKESLREEGRQEGREEARQETEQRYMPVLKRVAQEKGITVAELLEQEGGK